MNTLLDDGASIFMVCSQGNYKCIRTNVSREIRGCIHKASLYPERGNFSVGPSRNIPIPHEIAVVCNGTSNFHKLSVQQVGQRRVWLCVPKVYLNCALPHLESILRWISFNCTCCLILLSIFHVISQYGVMFLLDF